jgi:radical SAM superfamily enzyme YgiQ (UPF0313 family)
MKKEIAHKIFHVVLIKPSHYDDDGYVIQWRRSNIPSNTLAVLYSLARNCASRQVLGQNVDLRIKVLDETNTRIRIHSLTRMIKANGGRGVVGLCGVQSNQYPRALDIARGFRREGIDVCIGGFHVSGILATLSKVTPELQEALDLGVSLFAGEAEGRFEMFIKDAYDKRLKSLYNYLADPPNVDGVPEPFLPNGIVKKTVGKMSSFDAGRGCPFICSFCTIINVHGRKSRYRSASDIERIVRANAAQGIKRFFVTDDNFARNRNWEAIFDRLIALRRDEGIKVRLMLQVDTQCHRIPRFIDKAVKAGTTRVFIGLESINPDNLQAVKKKQNKISEYRHMLLFWRERKVSIDAGYILGFPADTPQSIRRDVQILASELPIERIQFYMLTPLPGSKDHQGMVDCGEYMDPDLNKYDLNHVTMHHPRMTDEEWLGMYHEAWNTLYSPENIEVRMRRAQAAGASPGKIIASLAFYLLSKFQGIQPLEAGLIRQRYRRDRRLGFELETPLVFYPRYWGKGLYMLLAIARIMLRYRSIHRQIKADPESMHYTDKSLTPLTEDELNQLDMFTATDDAAMAAVTSHRTKRAANTLR